MDNQIIVRVPAKLLLAGEYAVLYKAPALALALGCYCQITVMQQNINAIEFDCLVGKYRLNFSEINLIAKNVWKRYRGYLAGIYNINEVISQPQDLLACIVEQFLNLRNLSTIVGLTIKIDSSIPIGSGLGSSAAVIVGVLMALNKLCDFVYNSSSLFALATTLENLQHGKSSGFDIKMVMQGGAGIILQNKKFLARKYIAPWYIVSTGTPLSTTGECVTYVKKYINIQGNYIIEQLTEYTLQLERLLDNNNWGVYCSKIGQVVGNIFAIQQQLGIVPTNVGKFVAQLMSYGMYAKICGAGSVTGQQAGVLWVIALPCQYAILCQLAKKNNYQCYKFLQDCRGARVV